jgi:hypothetical protein
MSILSILPRNLRTAADVATEMHMSLTVTQRNIPISGGEKVEIKGQRHEHEL